MQKTSSKFKEIFFNQNYLTDVKIIIDGIEYLKDSIYPFQISRSVMQNDSPSVGGTVPGVLEVDIIPKAEIPRMAEIKLYARLTLENGEASEWIPKGTYYIDERSPLDENRVISITAYDSMLKAEPTGKTYADLTAFDEWPQSDIDVVAEIADIMGVTVDPRTKLSGYAVPYPNDCTAREVLGHIGAANCGNWTITDANTLLLIPLAADLTVLGDEAGNAIQFGDYLIALPSIGTSTLLSDEEGNVITFANQGILTATHDAENNLHRNVASFSDLGELPPFTGVTVWWDDEHAFQAGDSTGRVLELDCPWATQQMADDILSKIEGYVYHGFSATKAQLTPAAELGDVVVVNGIFAPILDMTVNFDGSYLPDIGAPADDEVDYEYKYETKTQRELARRVILGAQYYGVSINRQNGLYVSRHDSEGNEYSNAIINSDLWNVIDESGEPVLEFDFVSQKYKFWGDIVIPEGSISFTELDSSVTDAIDSTAQELHDFSITVNDYFALNDAALVNLQKQIDGQIETYYYGYAPTLDNIPASEWITEEERARHEGDLFYDKNTGYGYRFFNNNGVWQWVMIQDTDITKALGAAAAAQDTADNKRRVFVTVPTPPYDVGDLWTNGADLLTCTTARASGAAYNAADWSKLVDYTDDTKANEALSVAQQIANGMYSGGTFIDGDKIYSPHIYGGATLAIGANEEGYNFTVDEEGNVVVGASISFSGTGLTNMVDLIGKYGGDDNPGYIHSTYISQTKIISPDIYGGLFYATGKGADNTAAYYICDGVDGSGPNTTPNDPLGYISYDTTGTGVEEETERVIFHTDSIPIKIDSGSNMSLQSKGRIYVLSPFCFNAASFGYTLPSDDEGVAGQIFFLLQD